MANMFSFQNAAFTFIIGLIIFSWLIFLTVIFS
jgi:tetrahydromethanopterin S-methyltransferase subunit B